MFLRNFIDCAIACLWLETKMHSHHFWKQNKISTAIYTRWKKNPIDDIKYQTGFPLAVQKIGQHSQNFRRLYIYEKLSLLNHSIGNLSYAVKQLTKEYWVYYILEKNKYILYVLININKIWSAAHFVNIISFCNTFMEFWIVLAAFLYSLLHFLLFIFMQFY